MGLFSRKKSSLPPVKPPSPVKNPVSANQTSPQQKHLTEEQARFLAQAISKYMKEENK